MKLLDELEWQRFDQLVEELRPLHPAERTVRLGQLETGGESAAVLSLVRDELALLPIPPDDLSGLLLANEYTLIRKIGAGSMGAVYEAARQSKLGSVAQRVAVKLLHRGTSGQGRVRFIQEIDQLKSLQVAHVIGLIDARVHQDQDSGRETPFLVMPLIAGLPLSRYIQQFQPPLERRLELFLILCDAVHQMHLRYDVIHRDLKPDNILVDVAGNPWITDFGLAHWLKSSPLKAEGGWSSGTPRYMSPEQLGLVEAEIRESSDQYALGLILYELAGDRFPWQLPRTLQVPLLRELISRTPPDWEALACQPLRPVLERALALRPQDRYPSVGALRLAVEQVWKRLLARQVVPERREPVFVVPWLRNSLFQGRAALLDELQQRLCHDSATRIEVLCGLGGIGKTQTAVELAWRVRQQFERIVWFPAETREALLQQCRVLVARFDLPHHPEDPRSLIHAVQQWLSTAESGLLIFDNADEPELLRDFLPDSPGCRMLITSRAEDFSQFGVIHPWVLEPLSEAESIAFLIQRTGQAGGASTDDSVSELVRRLAGLPLALEQAGAYMHRLGVGFSDYLLDLQELQSRIFNEAESSPALGRPDQTVVSAWQINLQSLRERAPAAFQLLEVCSFLAPEQIPCELFQENLELLPLLLGSALQGRRGLAKLFRELGRFSLISRHPQSRSFSIHRLVQQSLQESLSEPSESLLTRLTEALRRAFRGDDESCWPACHRLIPHLLHLHRTCWSGHQTPLSEAATELLDQAGRFLGEQGDYATAPRMLELALTGYASQAGIGSATWMRCATALATLHRERGNYHSAETLLTDALLQGGRQLGETHPDCLSGWNAWGKLRSSQAQYAESEAIHRWTLGWRRQLPGPDHLDTAESLNNLAVTLHVCGRYAEALELVEQALVIRRNQLGEHHSLYARTLNNLGLLYQDVGRYREAEIAQFAALQIRRQRYGAVHPEIGNSLNTLGLLFQRLDRYEEAVQYHQDGLDIYRQVFGLKHPRSVACLKNLGRACFGWQCWDESERWYLQGLEVSADLEPGEELTRAFLLCGLADLYAAQQRDVEADVRYRQARAIFGLHAPEHPLWRRSLDRHVRVLQRLGQLPLDQPLETLAERLRRET